MRLVTRVLGVCLLAALATAVSVAAPFTISVNPLQGYLTGTGGTAPVYVSLATLEAGLGFVPGFIGAGTILTFQGVGDVCFNGQGTNACNNGAPEVPVTSIGFPFIGGFTNTAASTTFIAAPGATAVNTLANGSDFANDFLVTSAVSGQVTIPTGTNFLVFTFNDSFYPDNRDGNNNLGVVVTFISNGPVGTVPEPASYAMLLSGLGGLALFKRFRSRRS